jgi:hypothetical protein
VVFTSLDHVFHRFLIGVWTHLESLERNSQWKWWVWHCRSGVHGL